MDTFGRLPDDVLKYILLISSTITIDLVRDDDMDYYYLYIHSLCFKQWLKIITHFCDNKKIRMTIAHIDLFLNGCHSLSLKDDQREYDIVVDHTIHIRY